MNTVMDKVLSFLNIKGWEGVREIYLLVGLGALIGMCLLYYWLIFKRDPRPKTINLRNHIIKILLLIGAFWLICTL